MEIQLSPTSSRSFCINAPYEALLKHNGIDSAEALYGMQSETVKKVLKERGTSRVFLRDPNGGADVECYLKRYLKPSLKDRFKCATSLKPVFADGALHEWNALCTFHRAGLNTMIPLAAGSIENKTCNLTLGITDYVRASELFRGALKDDSERRQRLIITIADYAAHMHAAGLAHQDFYLVHLFVKPQENDAVYLIDLQRVLMQKHLSRRWIIKDLAQISFALNPFVSPAEFQRFQTHYESINPVPPTVWKSAEKKAQRIQNHDTKRRLKK